MRRRRVISQGYHTTSVRSLSARRAYCDSLRPEVAKWMDSRCTVAFSDVAPNYCDLQVAVCGKTVYYAVGKVDAEFRGWLRNRAFFEKKTESYLYSACSPEFQKLNSNERWQRSLFSLPNNGETGNRTFHGTEAATRHAEALRHLAAAAERAYLKSTLKQRVLHVVGEEVVSRMDKPQVLELLAMCERKFPAIRRPKLVYALKESTSDRITLSVTEVKDEKDHASSSERRLKVFLGLLAAALFGPPLVEFLLF